jgi:hypothetical protein
MPVYLQTDIAIIAVEESNPVEFPESDDEIEGYKHDSPLPQ